MVWYTYASNAMRKTKEKAKREWNDNMDGQAGRTRKRSRNTKTKTKKETKDNTEEMQEHEKKSMCGMSGQ